MENYKRRDTIPVFERRENLPQLNQRLISNLECLRALREAAYGKIPASELDLPGPAIRVLESESGRDFLASWALHFGVSLREVEMSLDIVENGHPSRRSIERLLTSTSKSIGSLEAGLARLMDDRY